jgi:hypothetical protein
MPEVQADLSLGDGKMIDNMSRKEAIAYAIANGIPLGEEKYYDGCDGPFSRSVPAENVKGTDGKWLVYQATDRARDLGHYELRG